MDRHRASIRSDWLEITREPRRPKGDITMSIKRVIATAPMPIALFVGLLLVSAPAQPDGASSVAGWPWALAHISSTDTGDDWPWGK